MKTKSRDKLLCFVMAVGLFAAPPVSATAERIKRDESREVK
jgi:hypothetical protein